MRVIFEVSTKKRNPQPAWLLDNGVPRKVIKLFGVRRNDGVSGLMTFYKKVITNNTKSVTRGSGAGGIRTTVP